MDTSTRQSFQMKHITIVGVGLIGGSLGKAWRSHADRDATITGVDTKDVMERAIKSGAIDIAQPDVNQAVTDADLVVIATPLSHIPHLLTSIAPHLKSDAIVTDVGSVKGAIADHAASVLGPDVTFVGGHPMAGSEKAGIDYADPFLFQNATYVICPPAEIPHDDPRLADLIDMLESTGARVLAMTPENHDRIAAYVSHLPQLLAVCLTNLAASRNDLDPNYLRLAAGGFRDMTRVAGSDIAIWRDILSGNHGPVLDALATFAGEVQRMRNRLIEDDLDAVAAAFGAARIARETIPKDSKGFISPLADVYVRADDRPGWIAAATTLLAGKQINIKDMELLKVREGTGGTFRFGFGDRQTAEAAAAALADDGYTVYRLD